MRKNSSLIIFIIIFTCSSMTEEPTGPYFEANGYALDGYDPAAYFEQSEARKGSDEETVEYNGSTYCFSSTKN